MRPLLLALTLLLPACVYVVPDPAPASTGVPATEAPPPPVAQRPLPRPTPAPEAPSPVARRPAPADPAPVARRPAPRPAPAPRARLSLSITHPRRSATDEPLEVTVRLQNRGPDAVYAPAPDLRWLEPTVTRANGRPVACRIVSTQQMPGPGDFTRLPSGRTLERTVDLSRYCELDRAGAYRVSMRYRVAAHAADVLPARERDRVWTGALDSNRLAVAREAREPRAEVRLVVRPAEPTFRAGEPVRLSLLARNLGPDTVALPSPAPADLVVELREPSGRTRRCAAGRAAGAGEAPHPVRAGGSVSAVVDLGALCGRLGAGAWEARLTWSPGERVRAVHAVRGAVPVWTGTAVSPALGFTVQPAARPSRPVPGPAAPRLSLSAPGKVRMDEAVPVTLRLEAPADGFTVVRPSEWRLGFSVRDAKGRTVACDDGERPRGRVRRRDFLRLQRGEVAEVEVDVAEVCALDRKGRYEVSAELSIPPTLDGRRQRLEAWTGRVSAGPVTVKVKKPRKR